MNPEPLLESDWKQVSKWPQEPPSPAEKIVRPGPNITRLDLPDGEDDDEAEPPPSEHGVNTATIRVDQAASAVVSPFEYSPVLFATPESSVSGESMNNHVENITPPESPSNADSPSGTTAAQIQRLSLSNDSSHSHFLGGRGRAPLTGPPATVSKRAASTELARPQARQSIAGQGPRNLRQNGPNQRGAGRPGRARAGYAKQNPSRMSSSELYQREASFDAHRYRDGKPLYPYARDSGYESMPSRKNTSQQLPPVQVASVPEIPVNRPLPMLAEDPKTQLIHQRKQGLAKLPAYERYPGLILQPDSSPISQDQLAAEVKGIYAGLVMVEAKCINIDAAQAADPKSFLGPEQWQALIALHRTLLYEHHDFLMATQHPSATPALRGLATKYSMPARMWRHGIHAFLEVLRHRRPESQDYMLAFIYLAYQMMALLFETVPTFTDTWIECLGDLARYRMAIEEEKEAHTIWGGVAARWYNTASDRHPAIGRLYHHLGILERPSLRKLFLYAKSLTCVIPFPNARDSLATLCGPIVQEEQAAQKSSVTAEARAVTLHAFHFSTPDNSTNANIASDALTRLSRQPASKLRDVGVLLQVTNIAAIFELGSPSNLLWQQFGKAINESIQSSRPSAAAMGSPPAPDHSQATLAGTTSPSLIYNFAYSCFNLFTKHGNDRQSIRDVLPSVHTALVWFHSIYCLRLRLNDDHSIDTFGSLLDSNCFSWGGLSEFLNKLTENEPISARTMEYARQGIFLVPEKNEDVKPLSEDYLIRGLIWTQSYFPNGWFNGQTDEDGRSIETASMQKARAERVQWLGLYLAFRTDLIKFNVHTKKFWTSTTGASITSRPQDIIHATTDAREDQHSTTQTPNSRSSTTLSAHSDSDGYALVKPPKAKPVRTWANVASKQTKVRQSYEGVQIVDDDGMQWSH